MLTRPKSADTSGAALSADGKWIAAAGYTAPATAQAAEGNGFITILPVGE